MLKIWGRNTSSNVQKVMWAIGEMKLPHQRIDVGGAFGKNNEAPYLAMNPNGLVPTLEEEDGFTLWEKRDPAAIDAGKVKTVAAAKMLDAQLGKTQYLAGDAFSYGDIPVGIMVYRFVQLILERPAMPQLDRWYAAISSRPAFKEQVGSVPLT
jgi:glutathione S-transferase